MAFKMKRTPIKGLADFFSSLGKEATSARQTKQKASNTSEYAGMTNFEKRRAEKKSRKPGESKFQADVRRRKAKKELKPGEFTTKQKLEGNLVPNQELVSKKVKKAPKPKAGKLTFKQAFAAARKAGKKTFTWEGNPYTTELAKTKKKKTTTTPKVTRGSSNDINQDGIDDDIQGLTKNR